jgi:hypothetical protein
MNPENNEVEIEIKEYPVHYHGHIEWFKDSDNDKLNKSLEEYGENKDLLGIG